MVDQTKGKNIFDTMMNAVTDRDEKAALEAAKQHMIELEQKVEEAERKAAGNAQRADIAERKVAELQATLSKSQTDLQAQLSKAQADLQANRTKIALLEQRAATAESQIKLIETEKLRLQQQVAAAQAAKAQFLGAHTIAADETLSHLSLKYYGHATEPYWRLIYEANKEAIEKAAKEGRIK